MAPYLKEGVPFLNSPRDRPDFRRKIRNMIIHTLSSPPPPKKISLSAMHSLRTATLHFPMWLWFMNHQFSSPNLEAYKLHLLIFIFSGAFHLFGRGASGQCVEVPYMTEIQSVSTNTAYHTLTR